MLFSQQSTILDDIFDPEKGWPFSAVRVPLQREMTPDGHPFYTVKVDGINLETFEIIKWNNNVSRSSPPGLLVAMTTFTGVRLKDPRALLKGTFEAQGRVSFGLNGKNITLQSTFPFSADFPLDITRKQLMVSMGVVAEEAQDLLQSWNSKVKATDIDWDSAKGAASVAGIFLRAFVGR